MAKHDPRLGEHASSRSFDDTVTHLTNAIERAGLTVFARIDHAANANAAGLTLPPATVLIYGNGKAGTPLMLEFPQAALDLPLRVLVQDREGRIIVAFHPIAALLEGAGVRPNMAARLEPAQHLIVAALEH